MYVQVPVATYRLALRYRFRSRSRQPTDRRPSKPDVDLLTGVTIKRVGEGRRETLDVYGPAVRLIR